MRYVKAGPKNLPQGIRVEPVPACAMRRQWGEFSQRGSKRMDYYTFMQRERRGVHRAAQQVVGVGTMNHFHVMTRGGEQIGQRRHENGVAAKVHRRKESIQQAETHGRVFVILRVE